MGMGKKSFISVKTEELSGVPEPNGLIYSIVSEFIMYVSHERNTKDRTSAPQHQHDVRL
jgi:hypothetical protein